MKAWLQGNWPLVFLLLLVGIFGAVHVWLSPGWLLGYWLINVFGWGGAAPRWLWLGAFIGLPLLSEWARVSKWTFARSLFQLAMRSILKVPLIEKIPVFGAFLKFLATQDAAESTVEKTVVADKQNNDTLTDTKGQP